MVPQFNDFVFNNAVGTIGVVETDYGFHVIKVMDKYNAVLLGTVAQKIQPSDATIDVIYIQKQVNLKLMLMKMQILLH